MIFGARMRVRMHADTLEHSQHVLTSRVCVRMSNIDIEIYACARARRIKSNLILMRARIVWTNQRTSGHCKAGEWPRPLFTRTRACPMNQPIFLACARVCYVRTHARACYAHTRTRAENRAVNGP